MNRSFYLTFLSTFVFLSGCSNLQTQAEQDAGTILYQKAFHAESVDHDFKKAGYLYEQAAELGNPYAQDHLRDFESRDRVNAPKYATLPQSKNNYEPNTYQQNTPNQLNSRYLQINQTDHIPNIRSAVLYQNDSNQTAENITSLPEVVVTAKRIDECRAKADTNAEKYADLKSKEVILKAEKVSAITGGVTGLGCLGLFAVTFGLDGGLLPATCAVVGALSGAGHNYVNSSSTTEEAERVRQQTLKERQEQLYKECEI